MRLLHWVAFAIAVITTSAAAQTPLTYVQGGTPLFSIDVPDFWTVRTGGVRLLSDGAESDTRAVNRIIGMKPEDDDAAWMGFVSPRGVASLAEGRVYLVDIAKHIASETTVQNNRTTEIGSRPAEIITASGTRDGRPVQITATLIDLPGARIAVGIAVLAVNSDLDYASEMNEVFGSFQVLR